MDCLEIGYIAPGLMLARLQDIAKSTNVVNSIYVKYHRHISCELLLLIFPLLFQYISCLWAELDGLGPVLEALMLAEQMNKAALCDAARWAHLCGENATMASDQDWLSHLATMLVVQEQSIPNAFVAVLRHHMVFAVDHHVSFWT